MINGLRYFHHITKVLLWYVYFSLSPVISDDTGLNRIDIKPFTDFSLSLVVLEYGRAQILFVTLTCLIMELPQRTRNSTPKWTVKQHTASS